MSHVCVYMGIDFEELYDDALLEIFNRLDASSLKNAALVCKRWDQVIGSSLSTMKKFTLNIHHKNNKLEDISSLTRRFQAIAVTLGRNDPWNLKLLTKVSRIHGSQVRKLVFRDTCLQYDINIIAAFFSDLPRLEYLEFSGVYFGRGHRMRLRTINPDALKQLKTLKVSRSCWTLLEFLVGVQVPQLQVEGYNHYQNTQYLANFLNEARTLENLEAEFDANGIFDDRFCKGFTFKLKKLDFNCQTASDFEKSFVNFLAKHAATLEELSFEQPISAAIFIAVFNKLKRLKKLTMRACHQNQIIQSWDQNQLNALKTLKKLTLVRGCYESPFVMKLMSYCPELEVPNFEIYADDPTELLQTLSRNNPKITFLSLFNWKLTDPTIVRLFKFLKTLQVQTMLDAENFIIFLVNTRSLETLSIQWVNEDVMTADVLEILRVQPNLKHLKVGGSFETAKWIYDELIKNHGKLETLELTAKVFSKRTETFFLDFTSASVASDLGRRDASEFFTIIKPMVMASRTEEPQLPFCSPLSVFDAFRKFFKPSTAGYEQNWE